MKWLFAIALIVLNVACAMIVSAPRFSHYSLDGGVFDLEVEVYVSQDTAAVVKEINKNYDIKITAEDLNARGVTFPSKNGSPVIIWVPSLNDRPVIAHELTHASISILNWAGVPLTEDTEETYAYMMQYLTKQIDDKTK